MAGNPKLETLLDKANNLPLLPGVYIMLDSEGKVIYVGKAKKLKNRVSSYFHGEHTPKVDAMVAKVQDFNVIVANSEFEALVLENSLIKRHKPHYNILLKDDKGYPYIRFDLNHRWPKLSVVSTPANDGATYFGPYATHGNSHSIVESIITALGMPDCAKKLPEDMGKSRPCLNYHMKKCRGWCIGDLNEADYKECVRSAVMLLEGKSSILKNTLVSEMNDAAEELNFEKAAELRDRIRFLERLQNRQQVVSVSIPDTDVIGFYRGSSSCFSVLHYNDGNLSGKDTEMISDPVEEDHEAVSAFICRYYMAEGNAVPESIIVQFNLEDSAEIEALLEDKCKHKVRMIFPKRGVKNSLCDNAVLNAFEELQRRTTEHQRTAGVLEILKRELNLDSVPERIEAFDISNLGNTGIVSAMTVFRNGKPLKKDYRRFRIKDLDKPDDYASMYTSVLRRYRHCIEDDRSFPPLPDMLLVDGGSKHAMSAEKALNELGLRLPVFGMVKDDKHRTRALVNSEGTEYAIKNNQAVYSFVGSIQEETHRYAIEYQRSIRMEKNVSALDDVPGVGPKRKSDLLKAFKTVSAVKKASLEELIKVVPSSTAKSVYEYFHKEG